MWDRAVEALEPRILLATFSVTNTNDAGAGSLRDALDQANAAAGADVIEFDIPGAGPHTIALQSNLPNVTEELSINGGSQPGFVDTPVVALDGAAIAGTSSGLTVQDTSLDLSDLSFSNFTQAAMRLASGVNQSPNVVIDNVAVTDIPIGGSGIRADSTTADTQVVVTNYGFDAEGQAVNLQFANGTFIFDGVSFAGGNVAGVPKFGVNSGAPLVILDGVINGGASVQNTTGGLIDVAADFTAGYILFDDNTNSAAVFSGGSKVVRAIFARDNNNATLRVTNGGLSAGAINQAGLIATGGGTVEVSGLNNSINTTNRNAIELDGVDVSLVFEDVTSTNSDDDGVSINNTSGTLTVTGDVTIDNPTNVGWNMTNSSLDVSLNTVTITGGTTGVSLVDNAGATFEVSGDTLNINTPSGVGLFKDGPGDALLRSANIDTPGTIGVDVVNNTGWMVFDRLSVNDASNESVRDRLSAATARLVARQIELLRSGGEAVLVEDHQGRVVIDGGMIDTTGANGILTRNAVNVDVSNLTLSNIAFNGVDVIADAVDAVARIHNNTVLSSVFGGIFFGTGAGGQGNHRLSVVGNNVAAPTDTQFSVSGIGIIAGAGGRIELDIANNTSAGNVNTPFAYNFGQGGTIDLLFHQQAFPPGTTMTSRGNVGATDFGGVTANPLGDTLGWGVTHIDFGNDGDTDILYFGGLPLIDDVFNEQPAVVNEPVTEIALQVQDWPIRNFFNPDAGDPVFPPATVFSNFIQLEQDGTPIPFDVAWNPDVVQAGEVATGEIIFSFFEPLPDDRFTLTISDTLTDSDGNQLDGDGNNVPGGDFVAHFNVNSRPNLATTFDGIIAIDANGDNLWNPASGDDEVSFRGGDVNFSRALGSDDFFAGNFINVESGTADGFDKLGVYGSVGGTIQGPWRFLIDGDNDGVPDGPDGGYNQSASGFSGDRLNGLPVAGDFSAATEGDEVGIFNGSEWLLDTNGDYIVDSVIPTNMTGFPIVGDFDGNGVDDLGAWADDQFMFDLDRNGLADATINFGFIGVRERPISADINQDGIDDIGLWTPDRTGAPPQAGAEWHFLLSDANRVSTHGAAFEPEPFSADVVYDFGDPFAPPLPGIFDANGGLFDENGDGVPDTFDDLLLDLNGDIDGFSGGSSLLDPNETEAASIFLDDILITADETLSQMEIEFFRDDQPLITEIAVPLEVILGGPVVISDLHVRVIVFGPGLAEQYSDALKNIQYLNNVPNPTVGKSRVEVEVTDTTGQKRKATTEVEIQDVTPPTASITTPQNGSEVVEGSTVPFQVDATDDVQVRQVDFLVNGVLAATDSTFPYEADLTAPNAGEPFVITAVAIDTSDNQTTSDPVDLTVIPVQIGVSITGIAFEDLNGNGVRDLGEPAVAGVDVTLTPDGGGPVLQAVTNIDGEYEFEDVEPGEYDIEVLDKLPLLARLPRETHITVNNEVIILFHPYIEPVDIHIPKWHDILGDGLDGTDERANGFEVRIYEAGNRFAGQEIAIGVTQSFDINGDDVIDPATESGLFLHTGLAPGLYDFVEVVPEGWEALNGEDAGQVDGQNLHGHLNVQVTSGEPVNDFFFLNRPIPGAGIDYGDAPDPTYPTLRASDGARHFLASPVFLGAGVDDEPDGQPTVPADGDDTDTDGDDEDGVDLSVAGILPGFTSAYTVTAASSGFLDAWVDWNQDGTWSPGEQIADSFPITVPGPGALTIPVLISVPSTALPGETYARFRYSRSGGLDPTGLAPDGEVEDYILSVKKGKAVLSGVFGPGDFSGFTIAGDAPNVTIASEVVDSVENFFSTLFEGSEGAIQQDVELPATVTDLNFDFRFPPGFGGDGDALQVNIDGQTIATFNGADFESDVFIPSGPIDLRPFAGQTVTLEVRLATTGDVNASVDVDNIVIAAEDEFNTLLPDSRGRVEYTDSNGKDVTVSLRGEGNLEVRVPAGDINADALAIIATGTNARSNLTVQLRGRDITTVGDIMVDGPINQINAKNVDLLGDLETGPAKTIRLNNVADDHNITISNVGAGVRDAATLFFNEITDLVLTSLIPIRTLTATSWTDTNHETVPDKVEAPSIGRINIKGNRSTGNAGPFEADIIVNNTDPNARTSLGNVTVAGPASGLLIQTFSGGAAGNLTFRDTVTDVEMLIGGPLNKLSTGIANNLTVFARTINNLSTSGSWTGGGATANAIKTLQTRADRRADDPVAGAGNLNDVEIQVNGDPDARQDLGNLRVAGGATDLSVDVVGDGGNVDIRGAVNNLALTVANELRNLRLGETGLANAAAAAINAVRAVTWLDGNVVADAIKRFDVTGSRDVAGDAGVNVTVNGTGDIDDQVLGNVNVRGTADGVWRINNGSSGNLSFGDVADGFDAIIDGSVRGLISKAALVGAFVAAQAFGRIDIKTNVIDSNLIAGGTADPASVGNFRVGGDFTGSTLDVGVDNVDDVFDGNDMLLGGEDYFVKTMQIGGAATGQGIFTAGQFPKSVRINGVNTDPLNDPDNRFVITPV